MRDTEGTSGPKAGSHPRRSSGQLGQEGRPVKPSSASAKKFIFYISWAQCNRLHDEGLRDCKAREIGFLAIPRVCRLDHLNRVGSPNVCCRVFGNTMDVLLVQKMDQGVRGGGPQNREGNRAPVSVCRAAECFWDGGGVMCPDILSYGCAGRDIAFLA